MTPPPDDARASEANDHDDHGASFGAPEHGWGSPAPMSGATAWIPPDSTAPDPSTRSTDDAVVTGHRTAPEVSPRRAMATLVALSAAAFLFVTNEIAPLGLLRLIAADVGVSESTVGLLTTVFAIMVVIATVPLTVLTTRMPRRPLITVTVIVLALGTLVVATADGFAMVIVGRILTATAHSLFWAIVTPAAAGLFPAAIRGRSVSRFMLGPALAGVVGLPASTVLGQQTAWQQPFWVLTAAAVVVTVGIVLLMPSVRTDDSSVARGEAPSLRKFVKVLAVVALSTGSMSFTWTYITPFALEVTHVGESTVPILLAVAGATGFVTTYLVGRFLDRYPIRSVAVGQATLGLMWLGLLTLGSTPVIAIPMIALQGVGWSILVNALLNWSMRHTPWSSDIGVGVYTSTFNLGNAVGSLTGGWLLASAGAGWLPLVSLGLTVIAGLLVWSAASVRSHPRPPSRRSS